MKLLDICVSDLWDPVLYVDQGPVRNAARRFSEQLDYSHPKARRIGGQLSVGMELGRIRFALEQQASGLLLGWYYGEWD